MGLLVVLGLVGSLYKGRGVGRAANAASMLLFIKGDIVERASALRLFSCLNMHFL